MITSNITNISSTNAVKAKVELYQGSTLVTTCTCSNNLQDFTVSRVGDNSKFFGFGVCQKLSINLIDLDRELDVSTENTATVCLGDGTIFDCPYPTFYITEVTRDEDDNTITATAYDRLYKANSHVFSELGINSPYTLKNVAEAISRLLTMELVLVNVSDSDFNILYEEGANLTGEEPLRDVLDKIAEATQTIYYINNKNNLVFKRLTEDVDVDLTISRDDYFVLKTKTNRRLSTIASVTELGDNVSATTGETGTTQYIRNNPFLELRNDIGTLLQTAINNVGGLTINQFNCEWVGNYLLEIGDKIELETEVGDIVTSYILNDTIFYDGFYEETTEWEFNDNETETATNPVTIGDKLNQTVARVDKVNKEITLIAGTADSNSKAISQLLITTNDITGKVTSVEQKLDDAVSEVNGSIETLTKEVNLKVTSEDVSIIVSNELAEGVDKVTTTSKKYTFDDTGLNISSSDSPISTTITEDGMRVYKNNNEVLTADNEGVKAQDLHAVTYLIIGDTSRLEDRLDRTAVFWIGD